MIRVLVADDSPTARALLAEILREDAEIEVVGEARDGPAAVRLAAALRPDLVTMDIHMPGLDGFDATREIMATAPLPIVIVSAATDVTTAATAVRALSAGALAVLEKPSGPADPRFAGLAAEMRATVRAMAGVHVVRHMRVPPRAPASAAPGRRVRGLAIAASTGGPIALSTVLAALPADFPAPILVVQHIARGFVAGFAEWLGAETGVPTRIARDGEALEPRTAYLAPDDAHLGVTSQGRVELSSAPAIGGFRPSATHLFRAAADAFAPGLAAVVLTGMGDDGVESLARVRRAGGLVIAQDETTSVVYGMPAAAAASGFVDLVLPLSEIGPTLAALARPRTRGRDAR